ncbi:DUF4044 domain-containing protein [Clostridium luticellarii]|uniref:DUF4044 domain-containing protein n=1 Tax=Clostridium luticellarii TaxID=1691940 RepID=A0A2T0BRF9_9CLOT|nr:DUF4044 domain-containing protein [Clostridium luticellarii]MCI1943882.1 DUF4044 domain-containing protein [Clostridium luticellarii]MCI1967143.1 DUF4044 domain-containing protein [Clostridium luticellarii]MCI1994510.1 DUF4044 domain-containing protein [Clostridium luticellarii]MCI2038537.1 DUF4044 domain-containing protein [Clostridium luticellarii]PRR86412.1 hypothetical protein CLLU_05100 [Clostridium luticellarii]
MKKQTRDKMTKALVIFVILIFVIGLLPMFFR